ncbi:MAG: 2-oxoglutarate-dependent dioxygenase, partial [Gammaproteobacteria bacterium]|nr:2-oxoglutarate-dependent dioxygenase [Gammaproteobacteria bacterium]
MSHGRVTPQLRHWIVKQIEAGQSPESVLESMIRNG